MSRALERFLNEQSLRIVVWFSLGVALSAGRAAADNIFSFDTQPGGQPAVDGDPFAKGHTDFSFASAFTQPIFLDRHRMVTGRLGIDYAPVNRFTFGVELAGDYEAEPFSTGAGGGFNVRGRFEMFKLAGVSFFFDASAGILESDHSIPTGGTHFNFIETAGVGAESPLFHQVRLMGGAHYLHISNAGTGPNPGYEGVEFYLGLLFPL